MQLLQSARTGIGGLEDLARLESPIHRIDPRAKLFITLFFAVTVISFPRHAFAPLAPFALYPILTIALAGLPLRPLLRRLLIAAPFALTVGAANPIFDREIVASLGSFGISGGWISFASIAARILLTVLAGLLLVATAGIDGVCLALDRLGAPRLFTQQILLMYRYLWVLTDEAGRLQQAYALRGGASIALRHAGPLAGQWLLRSLDRARRIHQAMLSRGFDGEIRRLRTLHFRAADGAWLFGWCAFFAVARWHDLPTALGRFLLEALP